jgi:hypothetical protein
MREHSRGRLCRTAECAPSQGVGEATRSARSLGVVHPTSITSKLVTISAVLASIALAEQYFS